MSEKTWDTLRQTDHKKGGIEPMKPSYIKDRFRNCLKNTTNDETLYIVRFKGTDHRVVLKRGTKCSRVVHVLACEIKLGDAYDHD